MSMELKSEDKQRIDEEEQKRVAEESYRAKVRTGLAESSAAGRKKKWLRVLFGGVCLVTAIAVALVIRENKAEAARAEAVRAAEAARLARIPQIHYVPVSAPMVSGQLTLKAGDARIFRFTIRPEMKDPHVGGRFTADGTNGADIEAFLMSEDELPNWDHGHQSKTLYSTNGPKTTDRFDVALEPGNYVLIFSNRRALLFSRYVTPEVELKYTKTEIK